MKNRIVAFDIINVLSCIAVLALHHNGIVHQYDGTSSWAQALVVEVMCYFAVPCFYMLTGSTLMRYDEKYSTRTFFYKRITRTVVPFIIWTFIWFVIGVITGKGSIDLSFTSIVNGVLTTKFQGVYWFFIPLFVVYALLPLLCKAKDDFTLIKYLILMFFVGCSCYGLFCKVTSSEPNRSLLNPMFGPLMFVLIGYLFNYIKLSKKVICGLIVLSICSLAVRYYVTYTYSTLEEGTCKILFDYNLPISVIPAVTIFYMLRNVDYNISRTKEKWLMKLSSCSLGVYLLHILVMAVESKLFSIDTHTFVWRIPMVFVTYISCVVIIVISRKLKFGKIIFP